MVTDTLDNAGLYASLGPRIARALDWVRHADLAALEPGRHEIDGDAVFALVSDYPTKPRSDGKWEAHRRYLDLQCVLRGAEQIGYAPIGTLAGGDYIPEKDIAWLTGDGSFVTMVPGRFMLLWPGDGHMPGITAAEPSAVRKLVVKIAV